MIVFIITITLIGIACSVVFNLISKNTDAEYNKKPMKIASRVSLGVVILALLITVVFGSFYMVGEDEQAVVTMFGQVQRTDGAGMHWKVPLFQQVTKVDVTTHGASIGYSIDGSTQDFASNENPQMITSDFNLINVDFYLEYKVNDPVAYLYNSSEPEYILSNEAMSCIRTIISDYPVDDVMTTAKVEIQGKIKDMLASELSSRNIGIQLVNLTIQDVEPPTTEVFNAFKSVESAKQQADTAINNAKRYQNEKLPAAEAEADKIVQQAEAQKAARIADAEGQVSRFNKMFEEYKNYPLITKKRLFFETMEDILPGLEVIITDGNTENILPLDTFANYVTEGNK